MTKASQILKKLAEGDVNDLGKLPSRGGKRTLVDSGRESEITKVETGNGGNPTHKHTAVIDQNGNGSTVSVTVGPDHTHKIENYKVKETDHSHSLERKDDNSGSNS
jgi:hypothetical protein